MMQVSFEHLAPLLLLAFGGGPGAGSFRPKVPATGATTSIEVPRVQTGGRDQNEWARIRYQMLLGMILSSGYVSDATLAAEIALSLLAQWAHETGRGASEYNYNLGGWRARRGDTYFTARDVQTPGSTMFRWTAYPDLNTGMADQVMRLIKTFPSASRLALGG